MEDDEFLPKDDVQAILDWALNTATLAVLMYSADDAVTDEDKMNRLLAFESFLGSMLEFMPETLGEGGYNAAHNYIEEVVEEEKQVEAFREQLDSVEGLEDL